MANSEHTFGSRDKANSNSGNSSYSSKKNSTINGINPENVFFGTKHHSNKPDKPALIHLDDKLMKALNLKHEKTQ